MTEPLNQPQPTDREIPILAVYVDDTSPDGYKIVPEGAPEAIHAAFAHLATAFARALSRPETEAP